MKSTLFDKDLQKQLDELMQKGYALSMAGDSKAAADIWITFWKKINEAMDTCHIEFMEDMNKTFKGRESIYNWVMDFEMELTNAAREDRNYHLKKIDFCSDYISRSKDKNEFNILVLKQEHAVAHFELGKTEEGEELFRKFVTEHPTSGWGWIKWSDRYRFVPNETKNLHKTIHILNQALEVEGLEDRFDVLERLEDAYKEVDLKEESLEVGQKIEDLKKNQKNFYQVHEVPKLMNKLEPVKTEKIGRNDPCPCGSGKKYKKCCGKV